MTRSDGGYSCFTIVCVRSILYTGWIQHRSVYILCSTQLQCTLLTCSKPGRVQQATNPPSTKGHIEIFFVWKIFGPSGLNPVKVTFTLRVKIKPRTRHLWQTICGSYTCPLIGPAWQCAVIYVVHPESCIMYKSKPELVWVITPAHFPSMCPFPWIC